MKNANCDKYKIRKIQNTKNTEYENTNEIVFCIKIISIKPCWERNGRSAVNRTPCVVMVCDGKRCMVIKEQYNIEQDLSFYNNVLLIV